MELPYGNKTESPVVEVPVLQPQMSGLTRSQIEVAKLLIKGFDNREMGRRLFVEKKTIEFHVCGLMRAFNVPTRYKLICALYDAGWR